jgi:hypothetical protein
MLLVIVVYYYLFYLLYTFLVSKFWNSPEDKQEGSENDESVDKI